MTNRPPCRWAAGSCHLQQAENWLAESEFELAAGEAFGPRNPDMLQWIARKVLTDMGDPLEQYNVGDVVQFPTPDGQGSFAGVLQQVKGEGKEQSFQFDFSHPLAGQSVTFEVKLLGVL